ncbi:endonuclease domain-containing protein [Gordonia sp. NPDC003424]
MTRKDVERLLDLGYLLKIRRGWYATPAADPKVVTAVREGGCLSCISVLRLYNVWVPCPGGKVHVRGSKSAHRSDPARFCSQYGPLQPVLSAVDDLPTAVRHAVRCLDEESIIVALDAILNCQLLEHADVVDAMAGASHKIRRLLDRCSPTSESGGETLVRLRLEALRINFVAQKQIAGVGRVDFLIGKRFIIEVDGYEFHGTKAQFEKDRARDLTAVDLGYLPIRLSYHQVVDDWPNTERVIRNLIRRREHLRDLA